MLVIPARMSLEDCARSCAEADQRHLENMKARPAQRRDAYKGSEVNRLLSDWVTTLMNPDDEMRWSLQRLRARCRDLSRNNPIVRQYLTMLAVNVIGPTGMKLQAKVRDNSGNLNKTINEKIEAAWEEWSYDPTVGGGLSLCRFEQLALKTVATDGECFVRLWRGYDNPFGLALEMVDADLVDELMSRAARDGSPEVKLGVQVNDFGRPSGYWAWNKAQSTVGSAPGQRRQELIPADQIIHLFDPQRANQVRGVPWLFSVMVPLKMLDGYFEGELVASRASANKMAMLQRKEGSGVGEIEENEQGSITMEANPGTIGFVPDGYELATWDPSHPSTAFAPFIKAALRLVACGANVSYNALANDLEGVNYSSMRSGLLIERDVWRATQYWWAGAFLRPVYKDFIRMSLLTGGLVLDSRDRRKFMSVRFTPRGWPWVDPQKDGQAAVLAIQYGMGSRTRAMAEQGLDFEETIEELAEEARLAEQAGVEITPAIPAQPTPADAAEDDEKTNDGTGGGGSSSRDIPGREEVLAALHPHSNGNGNGRRRR